MMSRPESEHPQTPLSERSSVLIDALDKHEIAANLLSLADNLWDTTDPDKRVMRFGGAPLDKSDISTHTAFSDRRFNSLSAAYKREGDTESAGFVFLTPQLYDATRVELRPDGDWDIIQYDNDDPVGTMRDGELLDLLNSKLVHSISMLDFARRLHDIYKKDFSGELISHLQHMGKTHTELRTYSHELRPQVPANFLSTLGIKPPYYRPGMKAELMRSEGIEAVDYRLRYSVEDVQIILDTVDLDGASEFSTVKNMYEFSFAVPYKTDLAEEFDASFVVSGSVGSRKLKQLASSTEPDMKAAEIFRNAIKVISEAKHSTKS